MADDRLGVFIAVDWRRRDDMVSGDDMSRAQAKERGSRKLLLEWGV